MIRLRVLSVLAVSSLIAAACSNKPAPGSVMLAVSTNLVFGRDFDRGLLVVATEDSTAPKGTILLQQQEFEPGETSFPFTVALRGASPDEGATYTARVRVVLVKGSQQIISEGSVVAARDLTVTLPPPGELQMAHISVDWLSMRSPVFPTVGSITDQESFGGDPFPKAQTECTNTINALGECVALVMVENGEFDRNVEPYDAKRVFGGGENANDAKSTCFPAKACFAGAREFTATSVGGNCQFDVGADADASGNVAVLTASADADNVARCGADGCGDDLGTREFGVVLDHEAVGVDGTVVTLPKRVCALLPSGAPVRISSLCPEKTRTIPLCPEVAGAKGRVETPKRLP